MKTSELAKMDREDRAGRTYQRIVYTKLVALQAAIRDAKRQGHAPLGVLDELDTQNLIEQLVRIADIEYRSPAENPNYIEPKPLVENAEDLPVVDVDAEAVTF